MSVVDAFALIAYLMDEPGSPEVGRALLEPNPCISAVNLAEVTDKLVRVAGFPPSAVQESIGTMLHGGFNIIPADAEVADLAGRLRSHHYSRKHAPISLADCFAAATAKLQNLPLVTGDEALMALARKEGLTVTDVSTP